jgi:hypothetical protein
VFVPFVYLYYFLIAAVLLIIGRRLSCVLVSFSNYQRTIARFFVCSFLAQVPNVFSCNKVVIQTRFVPGACLGQIKCVRFFFLKSAGTN